MEFFDSHSHYNDEKFNNDLDGIIDKTYEFGITKFMCVGYNMESSKKAIEIADKKDFIFCSVGISPNDIDDLDDNFIFGLRQMLKSKKNVAIGEIGLDYYWEKDDIKRNKQKDIFIKQVDLANELDLPIIIHTRDAYVDTISILKEHLVNRKGIIHCCPLNQELIKDALNLGFYISFSGVITFKNSKPDECIKLVPLDRLLIETDSPYLSPEPYRGKRNDSRNVIEVAKKISEVRNVKLEEISKITYENSLKIFNIKN